MANTHLTEWDTEEVLAFVHDVRSWRDLDESGRAEWCRRAKHVRDSVTTNGKPWTMVRLGQLFGLSDRRLRERFAWSESPERRRDRRIGRSPGEQTGDARRAFGNPEITPEAKAELINKTLAEDPEVRRHVAANLDPYTEAHVTEKVSRRAEPRTTQPKPATRDYDGMVERSTNEISVCLAAESSGMWEPSERSRALLYFLGQQLAARELPPDIGQGLVDEVEQFLRSGAA